MAGCTIAIFRKSMMLQVLELPSETFNGQLFFTRSASLECTDFWKKD